MRSDEPDEVLAQRAGAGDEQAFDTLVDRYATRVYGICWRYFRDADDAEDAAQAAFIACHRGLHGFRGDAAFSTWMYRVATNACHDLARRATRRPRTVPLEMTHEHGDRPDAAAADRLIDAQLDPHLEAALHALDASQRDAVLLRDVVGASYEEIAAAQGVAVGTAKSRVHRAHARLAEMLTGAGNAQAAARTPTVRE